MIRAHTVEQVRTAEADLMGRLPQGALMQRAAYGLAHAVLDLLGSAYGRRVVLLVGPGDNGGDALYAGAVLARRGVRVEAWPVTEKVHEAGVQALTRAGGRLVPLSVHRSAPSTPRPDLVVDGIVGIGGRPGLPDQARTDLASLQGVPVVSVDVPSGVDVDTGQLDGDHISADLTVTFGTHKPAHLVDPAAQAAGALHLVDLGLDLPPADLEALQPHDVTGLLPQPGPDAQKYTRGVVGIRAGSAEYPGAALLSVAGADTGLCGMVRFVGDAEVADRIHRAHPEVVGAGRVQAWVVGSGSGGDASGQLRRARHDGVPMVVDADALTHLDGPLDVPAVLTPHAGELAAMLGPDGPDRLRIEAETLTWARHAAKRYDAVVLLKGRRTLIARPDGRTRVTTTGVPWLATAGSGDVLGGLIGSLLAAGLDPFDAASVGSWVHGAAATTTGPAGSGGPMTATDVARALPGVLRDLLASTG